MAQSNSSVINSSDCGGENNKNITENHLNDIDQKKNEDKQKSLSGLNSSNERKGPDETKIKDILERTGYTLDVTSGQRKYGGPPPNWNSPPPGQGCEIFVGKIPKDIFEDELIEIFEKIGKIWDLRLMIDPVKNESRGYAFVTFCNKDDALTAVKKLDSFEVRKGKPLKVNISVPNLRLFVGNIPKSKSKEEIFQEFSKLASGLLEVIVYSSPDDRKKNRGFCFLEYDTHKDASLAKRKLTTARTKVWGCDILVDWADPQEEPDEETMSKVKVLYVRNLTNDVSEEQIKSLFQEYGSIERVKKIKDYAFIHFEDRGPAMKAMQNLNGKEVGGANIEVSLAKPPSDRKKKEEVLRNRERRVMLMMHQKAMMVGVQSAPLIPSPQQAAATLLPTATALISQRSQRNSQRNRNSQPATPSISQLTASLPATSPFRNQFARNFQSSNGWSYFDYPFLYGNRTPNYPYPNAWPLTNSFTIPTTGPYNNMNSRRTLWQPPNGNSKNRKQQAAGDGSKKTCKT